MKKRLIWLAAVLVGIAVLAPGLPASDSGDTEVLAGDVSDLPVVGSIEKLQQLLANMDSYAGYTTGPFLRGGMFNAFSMQKEEASMDSSAAMEPEYSQTNVQVAGVDEADVVKTDGEYIYEVSGSRVAIVRAYPASQMKVAGILDFTGSEFVPQELFVDGDRLVVIGSCTHYLPALRDQPGIEIYPPPPYSFNSVEALVYDIRNRTEPKKVREVEVEGNYLSSRRLGSEVYLVANRYLDWYRIMNQGEYEPPQYRDSASDAEFEKIGLDSIRYFPDCVVPNMVLVAGFDLDQPDVPADISTYLGAGENIYMSTDNLFVAVTDYRPEVKPLSLDFAPEQSVVTGIYRFGLNDGKVALAARGTVPGTIINQFSMDENEGYFRIATTSGEIWRSDEYTSKNNIFVLDGQLQVVGSVEGIAPGEKIYSTRFTGDRVYMVTFKTVDPLFVVDLSDPTKPEILGALKIPGYSDYLQPYDENYLLGFGKDTIELKQENWDGQDSTMAYYQGMKVALFDVSDVNNPVQKFSVSIGDRGTDSPILHDHKALLFSREKNLLAFPVTLMETPGGAPDLTYGTFTFQGAYVYHVDPESGFQLKGRITHLSDADYLKSGYGWYGSDFNVKRALFIGNTLYTASDAAIKANDLSTMTELNSLTLYH